MYDAAWYDTFVPASKASVEPRKQDRRKSLLKQPNEQIGADARPDSPENEEFEPPKDNGPPPATVARRAKSYTDFYHVARAQLRKEQKAAITKKESREGLKTEVDFQELYGTLADELIDASHDKYQLYHDQLRLSRQHLDSLLEDTSTNLKLFSTVTSAFQAVDAQTSSFQARCENLLSEQTRLSLLAEGITENLQYYNYLEPITRRLNAPGARQLVLGDDFPETLYNLDRCLEYMETHPHHKEAATYRSRYRLLLTRSLTLIRVYFTDTLREVAADVSKRIVERQLTDTTMSALLYAKFRVNAAELKKLGREVQKRAVSPVGEPNAPGEYQSLMNELYQSYSAARGRLIVPLIRRKMADIAAAPNTSKELIPFARSAVGYIRGICLDEYDLWHEWFDGDTGLYEFLEAMCEPLYDYLRPRIIREAQLPKLCEMCSLLQARYMEDQENEYTEAVAEMNKLDFAHLIRPALEDAQTRLVFLALAALRDDIERYKPKPEDLDYPARNRKASMPGRKASAPALSGRKESTRDPQANMPKTPEVVEEDNADAFGLNWQYNNGVATQGWYPTLRKAIWLLSRIYHLVNSTVFDDLAHRIVHQTTLSLQTASTALLSRRVSKDTPAPTPADAQLFLLKQLLILKQQIVAYDIEFVGAPDTDLAFSHASDSASANPAVAKGSIFNPANLFRRAGALLPRVVENMLDAKAELDALLRSCITTLTKGFAGNMTAPLTAALKTATVRKIGSSAPPADAEAAVAATRLAIEKHVPVVRRKLAEYLDESRTVETLVGAVEDVVVQEYEDFYEACMVGRPAAGRKGKGKGREDDVWDPETFAEWTGNVFGVVRIGFEEEDGGDDGFDGEGDGDRDGELEGTRGRSRVGNA